MRMSEISTEMRSSRCSICSASAPLSAVSRVYRGDIETIVAKALEKAKPFPVLEEVK